MRHLTYACLLLTALYCGSCSMPDKPVSKEEALKLAHRIEYSAANHDYSVLNNIFDEKELARRISGAGGLFMSKTLIKGAIQGLQQDQFGKTLLDAMGKEGTYELIKQYEKDKKQHLLFRLNGDNGMNYHDFELVKREDAIKAADVFIYMSGENLSKTIADALQLDNQNMPKEDLEKVAKIKEIKSLLAQGDYEKALQIYDELPDVVKKEKAYQMIHIRICSKVNTEKYIQALNEFRALYPKDPYMYLMMIDAYFLQKDYPMALYSVNKLDSLIDKDPYQDYQRGMIYLEMKDTLQAQQCFERLHGNMPKLNKGTIGLMQLYIYTHNDDKAAHMLREARDSSYLTSENMEAIYKYYPSMKKLVESEDAKGK